jgi:hypothetical protein
LPVVVCEEAFFTTEGVAWRPAMVTTGGFTDLLVVNDTVTVSPGTATPPPEKPNKDPSISIPPNIPIPVELSTRIETAEMVGAALCVVRPKNWAKTIGTVQKNSVTENPSNITRMREAMKIKIQ